MINEFSRRLQEKLELDLESLGYQTGSPLTKFNSSIGIIREALKKLKVYFDDHPVTQQEEIHFFKHIKPGIYRWKIYYSELYTIEENLPTGSVDEQINYLKQEHYHIERFFLQYQFQYQYYKLDATELDTLYFVRAVDIQSTLLPNVPELDPAFSTSCDYLFSKIKAYELLKDWIKTRLNYLKKSPLSIENIIQGEVPGGIRWTGDVINLAELGYGLYHTSQLNNGSAGIGEIFRWLENVFGVTIGIPAKRFGEIRSRKRVSRTKFIDEIKEVLERKLEKEDEYMPDRKDKR